MDIIILLVCSVLSILETVLGSIAYTHVSRTHLRTLILLILVIAKFLIELLLQNRY